MKRSHKILIALLVANGLMLGVPFTVSAACGNLDKFQLYVKALEYGLKGLTAYFDFIIKLFKAAIGL